MAGRPPIGKRAMTGAERAARHRAKRRAEAEERKRTEARNRKRAQRERESGAADATLPPAPAPVDGSAWFTERFEALPWQLEWLAGILQDDVLYGALSMARGNGKTTWAGAIAAATVAPDGPLRVAGTVAVAIAASFGQARELFEAAQEVLQPYVAAAPRQWRVLDSQRLLIEHRPSRTRLEVRAAESRTLHGIRKGRLFLLDEPAQWSRTARDKLYAAVRTSLGKVAAAKLVALGTRSADSEHWFERLLAADGGPVHVASWAAPADADPFLEDTWRMANPSYDAPSFAPLRAVIEAEAAEAKRDASLLPGFQALRLNQGVADHEVALLLEAGTWEAAECDVQPAATGRYALGLDLGGSAAMSAAAGYRWMTGRLDAFAYFAAVPALDERGRRDGVGEQYQRMHDRGELLTHDGRVVTPAELLRTAVKRWGTPAVVVADRYREAELRQAMEDVGLSCPAVLRGMGYRDGSEDVRWFQRATLAGQVHPPRSLLLRAAMSEARTVSDPAGNRKLSKAGEGSGRRPLARDDAAAAAILAVAEGARRAAQPPPRSRRWAIAG